MQTKTIKDMDIVSVPIEEAGQYLPEGFQGHGHLMVTDGELKPFIVYDLREDPPMCITCFKETLPRKLFTVLEAT